MVDEKQLTNFKMLQHHKNFNCYF